MEKPSQEPKREYVLIALWTSEQFATSADQACLRDLRTTNPRHDKDRIETDKGGLLREAYEWILDHADFKRWRYEEQSELLWIKGDPGKGKTMLLCGVIDELTKSAPNTAAISFYFCQASDVRRNHDTAVLRGLIFMLADQHPLLISHIREHYDKAGKQVFEDINAWEALSEILISILGDSLLQKVYLIIDALDECTTGLDRLLEFVASKSSAYPRVKWIVSSRNWPAIEETLDTTSQKTKLWLELNETSVAKAVAAFIHYKVQKLTEKKKYDNETRDAVSQHLLSNAHSTFLWVALVCKELNRIPKRHVRKTLKAFPPGLDELYKRMLNQINELDIDDAGLCKSLLGIVTAAYRPLMLDELSSCMDLPQEVIGNYNSLEEIVGLCGSFLTLREHTISFIHQSAKDFLLREAVHEIFPRGEDMIHFSIFSKSLRSISGTLRRDIYSLIHLGYPINQVHQPDPDPLAVVRYACIYWIEHLIKCSTSEDVNEDLQDNGSVSIFFRNDYLHWLEALSLSRSLYVGVASIVRLQSLLEVCLHQCNDGSFLTFWSQCIAENSQLISRVYDACRFILYHKIAIENYPLQVYASGLIFSPARSITRIQFKSQWPAWIINKPTMEEGWSACLQTLEGHSSSVHSVTFSHDSTLLASASHDRTVRVWDARSGRCLQTLEGHSSPVYSVTFSHDSTLVASGSDEGAVKVWDARSGRCLQTLEGHSRQVYSVTFSYDSEHLTSASHDYTIRVWDARNGWCLTTLEGRNGLVYSVTFSNNSMLLASASSDHTVKVWDASSGRCLQTLAGHSGWVYSVTFSYDSTFLGSASHDGTVKMWDARSGLCLQTLKDHSDCVNSVTFSYDSTLLASASNDRTVKVWDARSGQCLQTLEGHSNWVSSITFSHDSTLLASASHDGTVKVWDASGQYIKTIEGHSSLVNLVRFSHDSTLLASASSDHTVKVWDATSGRCLQTLKGHSNWVSSITFSHDSTLLASASHDCTVKVWDPSSGQCLRTLKGHRKFVDSAKFSHDSTLLASASYDCTVKVWDPSSGQCLRTLERHSNWVNSATFSHDSTLLASASHDCTVKVWDPSSGQCLRTLNVKRITSVKCFDNAKSYLITDIGTICLASVSEMIPTGSRPEVAQFKGYSVSYDGTWITWDSENLLWLPPEYRPRTSAVSLFAICLGCSSGRVLLFTFDSNRV